MERNSQIHTVEVVGSIPTAPTKNETKTEGYEEVGEGFQQGGDRGYLHGYQVAKTELPTPFLEQLRAVATFLRERSDQHPDASDVAAWLERVARPSASVDVAAGREP